MTQAATEALSSEVDSGRPHLYIVTTPYVFHSASKPITYLFAVNAQCSPEALKYENWGLVELVDVLQTEIVRGGPELTKRDLQSRVPEREWRIVVGNDQGPIFQERIDEGGWDENVLKDIIERMPESVIIIQQRLLSTFTMACDMAHASYEVQRHAAPLCVDCLKFGCEGPKRCEQRTPDEVVQFQEGRKFRLS